MVGGHQYSSICLVASSLLAFSLTTWTLGAGSGQHSVGHQRQVIGVQRRAQQLHGLGQHNGVARDAGEVLEGRRPALSLRDLAAHGGTEQAPLGRPSQSEQRRSICRSLGSSPPLCAINDDGKGAKDTARRSSTPLNRNTTPNRLAKIASRPPPAEKVATAELGQRMAAAQRPGPPHAAHS